MAEAAAGEAAAPGEAADLDRPLDYFAALLVRARSEEVLGWGADDFAKRNTRIRWKDQEDHEAAIRIGKKVVEKQKIKTNKT